VVGIVVDSIFLLASFGATGGEEALERIEKTKSRSSNETKIESQGVVPESKGQLRRRLAKESSPLAWGFGMVALREKGRVCKVLMRISR
jgi:hypothetical protein